MGQYAVTNVSLHSRWSLFGHDGESPFGLIAADSGAVVPDYFLAVLHKRVVGSGVLGVAVPLDAPLLVYAHCAAGPDVKAGCGAVTLMYSNPSPEKVTLELEWVKDVTDRVEYVVTAPYLESPVSYLNGRPLVMGRGGQLPDMTGARGDGPLVVPATSHGFVVLRNAGVVVCNA